MSRHSRATPRRKVDLQKMREEAAELLGWPQLDRIEAADMTVISERNWRRFESGDRGVPDSVIKLFWYEVGLTRLEMAENKGLKEVEKIVGSPVTAKKVFDYLHSLWEKWDPTRGEDEDS